MAVSGKNRRYLLKDIRRRHFNAMAARCLWGDSAESIVERLVEATPCVVEQVASETPAGFLSAVLQSILRGLSASAKRLHVMPAG